MSKRITEAATRGAGRKLLAAATAAVLATAVAATASGIAASSAATASARPLKGGTAYFAENALDTPNYIFPLISGENYSGANVSDLQPLLYRPLYWYGDKDNPKIDYSLSIGDAPVYSNGDKTVTITLKHTVWSDGEVVSARDVGFWINLLKANKAKWASYVPGGFPDNVSSWKALARNKIRLELTSSFNPLWFTNNELSQITPLPIAWDRTSASSPAPKPTAHNLPDTTTAGAKAVYKFLNGLATKIPTYATSPIWTVIDGPWKLQSITTAGRVTFVPNPRYTGPNRPHLSKFVELPFTSEEAEFSVLKAGNAHGSVSESSSKTAQISVGYVPDADVPQQGALKAQGYRLIDFQPWGFDYFEENFNNPSVGPIFKQLYFRQAFQHLVDEPGWIHAYYGGIAVPNYSPVPAEPKNSYSNDLAGVDPYPFSVSSAKRILAAHGWKVVPGGITSCVKPGTRAGECGAGIPAGKQLIFTYLYPSTASYAAGSAQDLQSQAKKVGIQLKLKPGTSSTIDATIEPCKPKQAACSWQLGNYGGAWVYSPDHYPSGEEIFETGALGNVNNYSDHAIDKLIRATTKVPAAQAQGALNKYANALRLALANFWQPSPGTLETVQGNLGGVVPNAYGFINPEEWYYTK